MIRWLSVTDAAKRIGLSRSRVGDLIRSGEIPAIKATSRWRVRESDAEAYRARKLKTTKETPLVDPGTDEYRML